MSASATAFLESSHGFVSGRKCIRDFVFPKAAMAFGGILLAATTLGVVIRNGKAGALFEVRRCEADQTVPRVLDDVPGRRG